VKAPDFWWRPPGLAASLLGPAALAYGAVAAARMKRRGADPGIPVICIGNVTVGGSGKTPTALAVATLLRKMGRTPAFLLRGYGGRVPGPVRVDPNAHRYDEVGDEALLLARREPTIVVRDRPGGAALCRAVGADVIVMDDGLQNPSLAKTFSVAVFDGARGFGNGLVLPAGPLRAPLRAQWPLIHCGLVIGDGAPGREVARTISERGIPFLRAGLEPDPATRDRLRGRRILAFAGIGRPSKFFDTLIECGAEIVASRAFPDHHPLFGR
jgi:tetraacyldisaccharide 4'-kinase